MHSPRLWLWSVPLLLYAVFWIWYTPLSGPMTEREINTIVSAMEEGGADPETIERIQAFFEDDDGGSFVMVNIIDQNENPPVLPATGPDANSDDLMAHYMEYMWPSLFSRASHPVFFGSAFGMSMDVVGIEGAEHWETAAMMRYRSRRDMWEIGSHPSFADRHDYKVAALDKTIAFPVTPQMMLSDLRFILLLMILAVLGLVDALVFRRGGSSREPIAQPS